MLLYKTDKFEGIVTSSEEGDVFWLTLDEMKQRKLAYGMDKMLEVFLNDNISEYFFFEENGKWISLNKCKGVISRQGLIYIPSMFILGAIFHETGLIWAQPVADVLSLLLAIGLYFRMSGKGNDLSSKGFGTIPKVIIPG